MKKNSKKRISPKNLPTRLGFGTYIMFWLLLDRFNVPDWAWGVYWTVVVLFICVSVTIIYEEHYVNVLYEESDDESENRTD